MELYQEYEIVKSQLREALQTYKQNMFDRDEAERKYRVAKAQAILKLNADNFPKTLIVETVKGLEDVSDLCLKRDIANSLVEANKEAINVKKIELKGLQDQMNREWTRTDE